MGSDDLDDSEKKRVVRDGYDALAERYAADRDTFDISEVLEAFRALMRPAGAVLDVGCGAGLPVARFLVDSGFFVTGIDVSDSMLELAAANVPEARLAKLDMTNLASLDDASFDGIVACYSLIHVPMAQHRSVIQDFARLLKPGGALLFSSGRHEWEGVEAFHGATMFWSHPHPKVTRQAVYDAGLTPRFAEVREHGGEHHYWVLAEKP